MDHVDIPPSYCCPLPDVAAAVPEETAPPDQSCDRYYMSVMRGEEKESDEKNNNIVRGDKRT